MIKSEVMVATRLKILFPEDYLWASQELRKVHSFLTRTATSANEVARGWGGSVGVSSCGLPCFWRNQLLFWWWHMYPLEGVNKLEAHPQNKNPLLILTFCKGNLCEFICAAFPESLWEQPRDVRWRNNTLTPQNSNEPFSVPAEIRELANRPSQFHILYISDNVPAGLLISWGKVEWMQGLFNPSWAPLAGRALCSFKAKGVGETQVWHEEGIPTHSLGNPREVPLLSVP